MSNTSKFDVQVTHHVTVTVDESKFTPEFLQDFRRSFYDFHSVQDHVKHLAQLYARGLVAPFTTFIEGYGPPDDFGIDFQTEAIDMEVEES